MYFKLMVNFYVCSNDMRKKVHNDSTIDWYKVVSNKKSLIRHIETNTALYRPNTSQYKEILNEKSIVRH